MSYAFSTEKVGSVKLQNFHHSFGKNLVLAGIDGQTNDADIMFFTTGTQRNRSKEKCVCRTLLMVTVRHLNWS